MEPLEASGHVEYVDEGNGTGSNSGSHLFDVQLPTLAQTIYQFESITSLNELIHRSRFGEHHFREAQDEFYDVKMHQFMAMVDTELTMVIGEPWVTLKKQNSGFVAIHSLIVLCLLVKDPLFTELNEEDQNVLKWAALLHDISKLSIPVIEGKDHVHPFKSASTLLDFFKRLGLFRLMTETKESQLQQVHRLLKESVQPLPPEYMDLAAHGEPICTLMHSHHNLPEIFYYLWTEQLVPRHSFMDLVFRLILFHQSLDGCQKYPPMQKLTEEERAMFIDPHFLKLMKPLMIADSRSYTLFSNSLSQSNREEFIWNNSQILNQWNEK